MVIPHAQYHLGNVIEAEIQPGDVLWVFHDIERHLVEALGVDEVVVGEADHIGIVSARRGPPLLSQDLTRLPLLKLIEGRYVSEIDTLKPSVVSSILIFRTLTLSPE